MIVLLVNDSSRPDAEVEEAVAFAHDQVGIERAKISVKVVDGRGSGGHAYGKLKPSMRPQWMRTCYGIYLNVPTDDSPWYAGDHHTHVCWHAKPVRAMHRRRFEEIEHERPDLSRKEAQSLALGRVYDELARLYDAGERRFGRWPIYRTHGWREDLVHLAAHEITHVLFWERDRKRGRGSEVLIEQIAERVLEAWRRR